MTRHFIVSLAALATLAAVPATAQTREYTMVHSGLRAFEHGDTKKATARFEQAGKVNPNSSRVLFALGNVALQNHQDSVALDRFHSAADNERNKIVKSMNFHDIGTVHYAYACSSAQQLDSVQGNDMQQIYGEAIKTCQAAIEAYKEALRNNPDSEDTRYNLALAQHLLKRLQEKQPQNDQSQDNKKNEDQNESNQGNNNQNDDQNQDQDNNGGNSNQPQNDQNKQSQESEEENFEQLLELSRQAEEQARQRIQNAQRRPARRLEKNW